MEHDIIRIVVIGILTWGCYALNDRLNTVPNVKPVLAIVIIVVGCLFLITPIVDVVSIALDNVQVRNR